LPCFAAIVRKATEQDRRLACQNATRMNPA
jgi:hypothetical protein